MRRCAASQAEPESRRFGAWESPITAESITAGNVGLGSLKCAPDGTLYWLEGRPQEGGRQVVCRRATAQEADGGKASERGGVEATPAGSNARTRVHEYGGAAYLLGPGGDGVIYSDFADQRVRWAKADGSVLELTPKSAYEEDVRYRFADAVIDSARSRLICVREDHTDPKPANVANTICALPLDGSGRMEVLVSGRDFYAAPRLNPDGDRLAYVCWDHPNMPWDATELEVASLDAGGKVSSTEAVCGAKAPTSVLQPAWSPDGVLHYMADSSGFWNLYRHVDGKSTNLYRKDAEFSGAAPGWALGGQNYAFLPGGRVVTSYHDRSKGSTQLVIIGPPTGLLGGLFGGQELVEFGRECLPRSFGGLCPSPDGSTLYFLGANPDTPLSIYSWEVAATSKEATPAKQIACSVGADKLIAPGFISDPRLLKFPTAQGDDAFGYYYPPRNAEFQAPDGAKPPLLVKAHGGPTACTGVALNPGIQFWTSRGFAVLDVDYRGSTGYGRAYREKLKGNWGVCDVEDVCAGATHLVKEGLVDPGQLCIDGGSAGGFTTLAALTFNDVFTAGCSLYGVGDLTALAGDTHKFESRYLDGLVGRYPEDKDIYEQRAPIKNVEQLSCPILLLQGAEDKIVPPNQAETMFEAVKAQGIPCAMKVYPGEQHGFRRSENIEDALNSELVFYARVFGFEAAGKLPNLEIANLVAEEAPPASAPPPASAEPGELRDFLLGR